MVQTGATKKRLAIGNCPLSGLKLVLSPSHHPFTFQPCSQAMCPSALPILELFTGPLQPPHIPPRCPAEGITMSLDLLATHPLTQPGMQLALLAVRSKACFYTNLMSP